MGERKVVNRYFPPDFDPDKVPLGRASGGGQHKVRLMAPFSMRCSTCGNYIYKGTKFNARKEIVWGEEYLDIVTYRFYIRCPMCASELTFKTDPKNSDYVSEHGMTRNFEAWREEKIANEEYTFRKKMEELHDPMRALENKTMDSKREIEILEMLDEVRTRNERHEKMDSDVALEMIAEKAKRVEDVIKAKERAIDEKDEEYARKVFSSIDEEGNGVVKKRILESEELEERHGVIKLKSRSNISEDVFKRPNKLQKNSTLIRKKPDLKPSNQKKDRNVNIATTLSKQHILVSEYSSSSSDEE